MRSYDDDIAFLIPYVAVLVGLYVMRSAWIALLLYHALAIVSVGVARRHGHVVALRRPTSVGLLAGSAAAASLSGVALYVVWPHARLESVQLGAELARLGLSGASWWIFAIYFATAHPVIEEALWRGQLVRRGCRPALVDVAFGGYHVLVLRLFIDVRWVAVSFALLVCAAWLWRCAIHRSGSITSVVISHAVADASIVMAVTMLLRQAL